jgi:hypothetical protein
MEPMKRVRGGDMVEIDAQRERTTAQFTGYGPALAKCRHGATACKCPRMRWKSSDRGDTLLDGGFLDRKENVGAGVRQSWVGQVAIF